MGLVEALGGVLRSHMHELHARGMDRGWMSENQKQRIQCRKTEHAQKEVRLLSLALFREEQRDLEGSGKF